MSFKNFKYAAIIFLTLCKFLLAQPDSFVRISANPKAVKVKQPFNIKISIYTTTWFTKAPDLNNIVIPGALTIKKDRARSAYENINNVRYTILYFDFFVFPARAGELTIPPITLNYATPETGDFKGIEIVRNTKPLTIKIDPVEPGYTLSNWLVANYLRVNDHWNKDLTKVKVGDVLERTITIKTKGTIAALIPSSDSLNIPWGRIYQSTPILKNEIDDGVFSSQRIEKISILVEKPGEFLISEQTFPWWNPNTKTISKRKIPERTILIEDNPDLTILRSIQDSLDAINQSGQEMPETGQPLTIFGLLIWQFIILLIAAFIILNQLRRLILYFNAKLKERKAAYLQSEKYYFNQFKKSCKQDDLKEIKNQLTHWINKLTEKEGKLSCGEFISRYEDEQLINLYNSLEEILFGKDRLQIKFVKSHFCYKIELVRRMYFSSHKKEKDMPAFPGLNP